MKRELVAPCGINCRLCYAYIRPKKPCRGCRVNHKDKPKSCTNCVVVNCEKRLENGWETCASCEKKCRRIKQLNVRYLAKYHVDVVENLAHIGENGMEEFLQWEDARWRCPHCKAAIDFVALVGK